MRRRSRDLDRSILPDIPSTAADTKMRSSAPMVPRKSRVAKMMAEVKSAIPSGDELQNNRGDAAMIPLEKGELRLTEIAGSYTRTLCEGDVVRRSRDRWKNRVTRTQEGVIVLDHQRREAAIKIQCFWRRVLSILRLKRLIFERNMEILNQRFTLIQRKFIARKIRRRMMRQRAARQYLSAVFPLPVDAAVMRVQGWYRWRMTLWRIKKRICRNIGIRMLERLVIPKVEAAASVHLGAREAAARRIQKLYRLYQRKMRALQLGRARRLQKSAECIQRSYRCFLARVEYTDRLQFRSARYIQNCFRSHKSRRILRRLYLERFCSRAVYQVLKTSIANERLRVLNSKAVLIQKIFRGYFWRQHTRETMRATEEKWRLENLHRPLFEYETNNLREAATYLQMALQSGRVFDSRLWKIFADCHKMCWEYTEDPFHLRMATSALKQCLQYPEHRLEENYLATISLLERNGELHEAIGVITG